MVQYDVVIDGIPVEDIFDVNYGEGETDRLGKAVVDCADNTHNRAYDYGDEMVIEKNGKIDFCGYLTADPTSAGSDPTIELEARDVRLELKYEQVSRVFYNMDSGDIIREALNSKIEPLSRRYIHTGSSLNGWTANTTEFELGSVSSQQLYDSGNDFIFVGWTEGAGIDRSIYRVTYSNVPSRAIPGDGTIDKLITRLLVNNQGQQFDVEVNLRDNHGNNYNWPVDVQGTDFTEYELNTEEANTEASIGSSVSKNGTLEYRFRITGELPEARAAGIDYAQTIPFRTIDRNTTLEPTGIESTDRAITRRVDRSIFELIKELATEDDFISYADMNKNLHYEPAGQQTSDLSINYNTTPVVEANFNRDSENVTNKVIVQGAGNIRVTLENSASIQFYGVAPREEPIIDEDIQTREEATQRGRGYLRKNAWDDSAFEFEIADADYQDLRIGNDIEVTWPPESINGIYSVADKSTDRDGIVSVDITSTGTL